MQIYLVGGAVRDALMGLPLSDRDWVVVGATPAQMTDAGYVQVGRDFPVFLHPKSKDEYALARTERKTGPGYRGFEVHAAPDVTLEEDLARRDLTINAMAVHGDAVIDAPSSQGNDGLFPEDTLIDPFGGQRDLHDKLLRHVTDAFQEDPVRILRVARFAARFADYTVAPETTALMRRMVQQGEADHLVAERVWQEVARGLMEKRPSRMLDVLRDCGALQRVLPELDRLWGVPQRADYHPEVDTGIHMALVLDMAARLNAPLPVRFACLTHDLGKGTTPADVLPRHIGHEGRSVRLLKPLCQRLRVPVECSELAEVVAREHGNIHRSSDLGAEAVLRLLERCDAFRKPERFADMLLACECDARGRQGLQEKPYPQRQRLLQALDCVLQVPTHTIAQAAMVRGDSGPAVGRAIHAARLQALKQLLAEPESEDN